MAVRRDQTHGRILQVKDAKTVSGQDPLRGQSTEMLDTHARLSCVPSSSYLSASIRAQIHTVNDFLYDPC